MLSFLLDSNDVLVSLYQENGETARVFWEWRHKVILLYFAIIAGVFASSAWIAQSKEIRRYLICVPLLLGTIGCEILDFMEATNKRVLLETYRNGADLEKKLVDASFAKKEEFKAIYTKIHGIAWNESGTYTQILPWLYRVSAGFLFLLCGICLLKPDVVWKTE